MSRCPLPSTSRSLAPLRSRPNRRIVEPEQESQTKPPLPRFQSTAKTNRSFLLALAISTSCPLQSEHTPAKRPGKQCGRPEPWPASRLPRLLRNSLQISTENQPTHRSRSDPPSPTTVERLATRAIASSP